MKHIKVDLNDYVLMPVKIRKFKLSVNGNCVKYEHLTNLHNNSVIEMENDIIKIGIDEYVIEKILYSDEVLIEVNEMPSNKKVLVTLNNKFKNEG